jgi:hypothetical protein
LTERTQFRFLNTSSVYKERLGRRILLNPVTGTVNPGTVLPDRFRPLKRVPLNRYGNPGGFFLPVNPGF